MAKRRRGPGKAAQRVELYHWVIKSPAWAGLSGNHVKVLIDLWRYHNGYNNGQISYSCEQAGEAINASGTTGWRALKLLVKLGFLRITEEAAFRSEEARVYALTTEPVGKEPRTKDFIKLTAAQVARIVAEDRAENRSVISPMKPHCFTSETTKVVFLKAGKKINGVARGAGGRKNGTARTPLKTAKKPTRPA